MPTITRDFTVAVFVVHAGHVILHRHPKLGLWLPPGGHIEPNELPDEAALREVREETGLAIVLHEERGLPVDYPDQARQLIRPAGIQLESISPGHEHIDLVYFATLRDHTADAPLPELFEGMMWVAQANLSTHELLDEVRAWCDRALGQPDADSIASTSTR